MTQLGPFRSIISSNTAIPKIESRPPLKVRRSCEVPRILNFHSKIRLSEVPLFSLIFLNYLFKVCRLWLWWTRFWDKHWNSQEDNYLTCCYFVHLFFLLFTLKPWLWIKFVIRLTLNGRVCINDKMNLKQTFEKKNNCVSIKSLLILEGFCQYSLVLMQAAKVTPRWQTPLLYETVATSEYRQIHVIHSSFFLCII